MPSTPSQPTPATARSWWILGLAGGLFAAWSLVLAVLPWRAHIAESNYHSNLIRLEHALFQPRPHLALVGSSITGRLLPEYFEGTPAPTIANLGLDGSGPLLGLELLAGQSNPPPVVLIEANLLMVPEGPNDRTLRAAVDGFGFTLARHIPLLRADARPTSLVYSWLKRRRDAASVVPPPQAATDVRGTATAETTPQETRLDQNSPAELGHHKERIYELCRRLKQRGITLVVVRFPTQAVPVQTAFHPLDFTGDLARDLGVRRIDLGKQFRDQGQVPGYTDGIHLAPASARLAASLLVAEASQARVP